MCILVSLLNKSLIYLVLFNDFYVLEAGDVPCYDEKEVFMLSTSARLHSKIIYGCAVST